MDKVMNIAGKSAQNKKSNKRRFTAHANAEYGQSSIKKRQLNQVEHESEAVGGKHKKNIKDFKFGNYKNYYWYRNKNTADVRLEVFKNYSHIFEGKSVLDIGCYNGFITSKVAQLFNIKNIVGIDIDNKLITKAVRYLITQKKEKGEDLNKGVYPFNVYFKQGNYVLKDDALLEIETEQYDIILCLSVTKYIQLNFGDEGLKRAFKRIFAQLHSGGKLILEAQEVKSYYKRRKISDEIFAHFKAIKLFPNQFTDYLLSAEVGFKKVELMGLPENCNKGFKRPIQIFTKE